MIKFLMFSIYLLCSLSSSLIEADDGTYNDNNKATAEPEGKLPRYLIEEDLRPAIFGSFRYNPVYRNFSTIANHRTTPFASTTETVLQKHLLRTGSNTPTNSIMPERVTVLYKGNPAFRKLTLSTPASWIGQQIIL